MTRSGIAATAAVALIALAATADAAPPVFAHIQTDKPLYRLGETVFYRVHFAPGTAQPVVVTLRRENGTVVAKKTDVEGALVLPEDLPGGDWTLVAECAGRVVHEAKLSVYDVTAKQLDLSLTVLGESHYPGEDVTATVSARDLQGLPVEGARVKFRATFGTQEVVGTAGPTDPEGRALVRFAVPALALRSGFLSVGLEAGKAMGATARPVQVSAGVARVDAFSEGGSIVPGGRQRLALLVRDRNGDPTISEGRVLDDAGKCVEAFRTDRRGLCLVDVKIEKDHLYSVNIDRPAGVTETFPLPGPTGHAHALRIERQEGALTVSVRGKKTTQPADLMLVTRAGTTHADIHIGTDGDTTVATFPIDGTFELAHLLLKVGDVAELKCPVFVGSHFPVSVAITPREGRRCPGDTVILDVQATENGQPVATDLAISVLNEGVAGGSFACDLPIRSVIAPQADGLVTELADLGGATATDEITDRRTAWILVHDAYAYPKEGVPFPAKGLPDAAIGRISPVPIAPRVEAPAPGAGKTLARATALDRLVQRAPFTRTERPRALADRKVGPAAGEAEPLDAPGRGRKELPQDLAIPAGQFDCRDTLFWRSRVTTDKTGHAAFAFKLGHEVSPLLVAAEGFARSGATSASAEIRPAPSFSAKFAFPEHLTVGDTFELLVDMEMQDPSLDAIQLAVSAPPCLKALLRSELDFDPRTSNRTTKFMFEATGPAQGARLTVSATRGAFREVTTRTFGVGFREVEMSCGKSGFDKGTQAFAFKVPENAIKGTVSATESVRTTSVATATMSVEGLLQEPHGCFEQTTATNYPNLMILEALMKRGTDARTLERATSLAKQGFERILTFQEPDTGGFCLWEVSRVRPAVKPGEKPASLAQARYTAMAIVQLARFAKLFNGRGSLELERAIEYLEKSPKALEGVQGLYVAMAVTDSGARWSVPEKILRSKPGTNYERALLANVLMGTPRDELANELEQAIDPTGRVPSEGSGIMGSTGEQLSVETTALAATALKAAGRGRGAESCLRYLTAQKDTRGGWNGTQATALAIRALAQLFVAVRPEPVLVQFAVGAERAACTAGGDRNRAITFTRALDAAPGAIVNLGLDLRTKDPLEFTLACTYRIANPRNATDAPYRIVTRLPNLLTGSAAATLDVEIEQRRTVEGQVVAKIGIPGGCTVLPGKFGDCSHSEVTDGMLVLYWEKAPPSGFFKVPLKGAAAGNYLAVPSVIYPYYESGKEAFAPGLTVRVVPAYDEGAAGADKAPAAPPVRAR